MIFLVDVATDKHCCRTGETIYISANITHQNGTVMTPPRWANVNITMWDATSYYWDIMPNMNMTYKSRTELWDYSCTMNVTDPSAQFPFHWNITVSADDSFGNTCVGSTAVNTWFMSTSKHYRRISKLRANRNV